MIGIVCWNIGIEAAHISDSMCPRDEWEGPTEHGIVRAVEVMQPVAPVLNVVAERTTGGLVIHCTTEQVNRIDRATMRRMESSKTAQRYPRAERVTHEIDPDAVAFHTAN